MASNHSCKAMSEPGGWQFCPNENLNHAFTVLFGIALLAHIVQGFLYRQAYAWVICMSALWQFLTYAIRGYSMNNPSSVAAYTGWFVLILCAPIWANAYVYMVVGRMVRHYVPDGRIVKITAWRFGQIFVWLDIISFLIQALGAATSTSGDHDKVEMGLNIYKGGTMFQQVFIFVFCYFLFVIWLIMRRESKSNKALLKEKEFRSGIVLVYILAFVLILITLRIFFRLVECSDGVNGYIPNHEIFAYTLNSLPMLLGFIALSIIHPSRIMRGGAVKMPSRKERKRLGLKRQGAVAAMKEQLKHPNGEYDSPNQSSEGPGILMAHNHGAVYNQNTAYNGATYGKMPAPPGSVTHGCGPT